MLIAILSDIHGNLEALTQVLEDARAQKAEEFFCLGDIVGYGPDPDACLDMVRENQMFCVKGNHELALDRPEYQVWFNRQARQGIKKTAGMISSDNIDYLKSLPNSLIRHGCGLVHGMPPDSVVDYFFQYSDYHIYQTLLSMPCDLFFVGHTHLLGAVSLSGETLERMGLGKTPVHLDQGKRWIINVGSVGQPRDDDPHARYVLFDLGTRELRIRFVTYDIRATKAKIRLSGLSEFNAERLGDPDWD